jgi:hypothetical protein
MVPNQFNSLKFLSDCPVCHRKKFPADIKLLEELDDSHLLHVRCKICESSLVVMVTMGEQGISLVGILTDLQSDEVGLISDRGSLQSDDIIDLHLDLQKKDFIKENI